MKGWWHRRALFPPLVAAALVLLVAVVVGVIALTRPGTLLARGQGSSGAQTSGALSPQPGASSGQAGGASPSTSGPAAAGKLPVPAQAGVVEQVISGTEQPLSIGSTHLVLNVTNLPQPGPTLAVYRYAPASGPAAGTILEVNTLPPGLAATSYPSRQPGEAFSEAAAHEAGGNPPSQQLSLAVTQARLVYVAVVAGENGYLEPAYLFAGSMRFHTIVQAQILVPALAASALA
jgi:hypothetical protein